MKIKNIFGEDSESESLMERILCIQMKFFLYSCYKQCYYNLATLSLTITKSVLSMQFMPIQFNTIHVDATHVINSKCHAISLENL